MPNDPAAAPAWPDEVVEAVAAAICLATSGPMDLMAVETQEVLLLEARAALAAIAPHVAAEVAAAERRGIERAAAWAEKPLDINSRKARAHAIRCLPPSDPSGASALAHVVRCAVDAERDACAAVAENEPMPTTENSACPGGPTWRTKDPNGWGNAIAAAIRARGDGGAA